MRAISRLLVAGAWCVLLAACGGAEEKPNSCGNPQELNVAPCGDTECNWVLGCPATSYRSAGTWQNAGAWWMAAAVLECSACSASIHARLTLRPAADADFDLHVWRACGGDPEWSSASQGLGVAEQVVVGFSDSILPDEIMHFTIEVRPRSGAASGQWTLTLEGTDC